MTFTTALCHGRLLTADVTIRGQLFSFANIYVLAQETERLQTLEDSPFDPSHLLFVAGDWNIYPDPERDRHPRSSQPYQARHWTHFAPAIASYFDAALQGSTQPYFTFSHTTHQYSARLDHIYVSLQYPSAMFSTAVSICPHSDYSAVAVL
jgi:hypothetical protein